MRRDHAKKPRCCFIGQHPKYAHHENDQTQQLHNRIHAPAHAPIQRDCAAKGEVGIHHSFEWFLASGSDGLPSRGSEAWLLRTVDSVPISIEGRPSPDPGVTEARPRFGSSVTEARPLGPHAIVRIGIRAVASVLT